MKNKKIVFITPIYLPANLTGSGMVVKELAEELAKKGYDVSVITSNALTARYWYDPIFGKKIKERESIINNVKIIRLNSLYLYSVFYYLLYKLIYFLFSKRNIFKKYFDYVEIMSIGPFLKNLEKVMVKVNADNYIISPFPLGMCYSSFKILKKYNLNYSVIPFFKKGIKIFQNTYLLEILNNAKSIYSPTITESEYIKKFINNSNIFLLPSSLDIEFLESNMAKIKGLSKKLKNNDKFLNKKIVLFAGIKGRQKGIIDAAKAIILLNDPNIYLITMGSATKEWENFKKENADKLNNLDLSYQAGILKYAYFMLGDILVLPSLSDNFPLVFLEAWYFKKPVIAYNFYTIPEILNDGSGLMAEKNNIKELAEKIILLFNNKNLAEKIGLTGFSKVHNYDINNVVNYFIKGL